MAIELASVLRQRYNLHNWQEVYHYIIPGCTLFQTPSPIEESSPLIERMCQIGYAELDGKKLILFDVEVAPNVILKRNRVALNSVLARWLTAGQNDAAIGIFHSAKTIYAVCTLFGNK